MLQMLQLRKLNGVQLKEAKNTDSQEISENLVSGLFFDSEIDPDLKVIIERWPELSVELRQAIIKMIR